MKKIYLLLIILSLSIGFAQENNRNTTEATAIPVGYYNAATGTGYTLKTQLKTIITNGHIDRGYGSGSSTTNNGLWTAYGTTDRDNYYDHDNTVLDMYSENPTGTDPYTFSYNSSQCGSYSVEGDCYNREHIIPQSVFASADPMHNDPHFVTPTDGKVNGLRSDFPHGMVGTASSTTLNGSKLGSALNSGYAAGYAGTVFEPINEFKGDIARMYFYFATRYESTVAGYSYPMFNGTSTQVFTNTFLEILKHWHQDDPVNQREIDRNNAIYTFQGNRNPYIDHPEWVTTVWGAPLATTSFDALASVSVYPNPSNDHKINIQTEVVLDNIQLITVNGQIMQEIKRPVSQNNSYTVENLPQGFYILKLTSNNQSTIKKVIVN